MPEINIWISRDIIKFANHYTCLIVERFYRLVISHTLLLKVLLSFGVFHLGQQVSHSISEIFVCCFGCDLFLY